MSNELTPPTTVVDRPTKQSVRARQLSGSRLKRTLPDFALQKVLECLYSEVRSLALCLRQKKRSCGSPSGWSECSVVPPNIYDMEYGKTPNAQALRYWVMAGVTLPEYKDSGKVDTMECALAASTSIGHHPLAQ